MTTLALLKATIEDDTGHSFASVGAEINRAIQYYSREVFYFNQTRDLTFNTVVGQIYYSATDSANIPLITKLHAVVMEEDGEDDIWMRVIPIEDLEILTDGQDTPNRPFNYVYFNMGFGLYPIPDDVYTIRMIGNFRTAAPASDSEADNLWMTEAYDLIRARVNWRLFKFKLRDHEMAAASKDAENDSLNALNEETSRRLATNKVMPSNL